MSGTYGIKITGVLARVGYYGRIRFVVCDRRRGRWVEPRFVPRDDGMPRWLRVDDYVFSVAEALYLHAPDETARVARAELVLGEASSGPVPDGSLPDGPLVVEQVRSIWVEDPPEPALP